MTTSESDLKERYEQLKSAGLSLDITRGQPASAQFDLSAGLIDVLSKEDFTSRDGVDCRNYPGGVTGLKEARELFAKVLDITPEETIVGNNSSLLMLNDVFRWIMIRGTAAANEPWQNQAAKMICPVPGYDRHFTMCQALGVEMLTCGMDSSGPLMDEVEKLAASDASVKGIVLVPQYSNPTGLTFSDEVVDRLAAMKTAAKDFTIFWDNAYAVHHLVDSPKIVKNLLRACEVAGNADRAIMFSSTSKITFSGAGLGFMGASLDNIKYFTKLFSTQFIGPDKFNQLRHVKFFESYSGGLEGLMKDHASLVKPKFDAVDEILTAELGEVGAIANWTKPEGGYFVSLDTAPGLAKRVVELAAEAGVKLTQAGATYPNGMDPKDCNIRISPTRPPLDEVRKAMEVLGVCVKLAAAEAA